MRNQSETEHAPTLVVARRAAELAWFKRGYRTAWADCVEALYTLAAPDRLVAVVAEHVRAVEDFAADPERSIPPAPPVAEVRNVPKVYTRGTHHGRKEPNADAPHTPARSETVENGSTRARLDAGRAARSCDRRGDTSGNAEGGKK